MGIVNMSQDEAIENSRQEKRYLRAFVIKLCIQMNPPDANAQIS